jgi:hypothetical protein
MAISFHSELGKFASHGKRRKAKKKYEVIEDKEEKILKSFRLEPDSLGRVKLFRSECFIIQSFLLFSSCNVYRRQAWLTLGMICFFPLFVFALYDIQPFYGLGFVLPRFF